MCGQTFTWFYLYLSILQNKSWDSSSILILDTVGRERDEIYNIREVKKGEVVPVSDLDFVFI